MRKLVFLEDEVYHVYNRGVGKMDIFLADVDRHRFLHDLFEFNDYNSSHNTDIYFNRDVNSDISRSTRRAPRELMVELLGFCLMDNHYHLLVKPKAGPTPILKTPTTSRKVLI